MTAKRTGSTVLWDILGIAVVGYLAVRLLPGLVNRGSSSGGFASTGLFPSSGASGAIPIAASYRTANGQVSTSANLQQLLAALLKQQKAAPKPSASMPTAGGGGGAPSLPFSGLLDNTGLDLLRSQQHVDPNQVLQAFGITPAEVSVSGYDSPALDSITVGDPNAGGMQLLDLQGTPINSAPADTSGLDNYSVSGYDSAALDSITIPDSTGDSSSYADYVPPIDLATDPQSFDGGGYQL